MGHWAANLFSLSRNVHSCQLVALWLPVVSPASSDLRSFDPIGHPTSRVFAGPARVRRSCRVLWWRSNHKTGVSVLQRAHQVRDLSQHARQCHVRPWHALSLALSLYDLLLLLPPRAAPRPRPPACLLYQALYWHALSELQALTKKMMRRETVFGACRTVLEIVRPDVI